LPVVAPRLVIFAALRHEAVAIARPLRLSFESAARATGNCPNGLQVELHVVGPRCASLRRDIDLGGCVGVVMAGLAGALEPGLSVGDVVVDEASDFPMTDGQWRRGGIHTAGDIVATPAGKAALFRAGGELVVEMENAVARRFAAERGAPFLGLRAVSDAAAESLDPAVLRFLDASGRVRLGSLAAELCRRPRLVPTLWRLRSRTAIALRNLASAVHQIVEESGRR
jgi:hypothetical protein